MDKVECNDFTELRRHLRDITAKTLDLKLVAWRAFSNEFEQGKSAYIGNLLAEIGTRCDIVTNAVARIAVAGGLIQEELDKIEQLARGTSEAESVGTLDNAG